MTLGLFDPAFLGGLAAGGGGYDADAQDFINRVIAADVAAGNTSGLEVSVQDAYNTFFVGCKADGIFGAIKASCILAGARTLNGALVPLVSTMPAPTNFNFVAGDYNRKTGLLGDGSTKYINSNRANNADPQDDCHYAVHSTAGSVGTLIGVRPGANGDILIVLNTPPTSYPFRCKLDAFVPSAQGTRSTVGAVGFIGVNRSSNLSIVSRLSGTNETINSSSTLATTGSLFVFARNRLDISTVDSYTDARISFYSIGESVNLALLDARVSTLMSDLAAAIP